MTKRMLIDATHAEETRVVVLDGNRLEDFDVETSGKKQLKGNIYLAKIVRVEPSLQAAFVEYGGGRHGFLAFGEIHPDYYQIPVADRQRLLEMQAEEARAEEEAEDAASAREEQPQPQRRDGRERGGRPPRDQSHREEAPATEFAPAETNAATDASAIEGIAAIEGAAAEATVPHDGAPVEGAVSTEPALEPSAPAAEAEAAAGEATVPHQDAAVEVGATEAVRPDDFDADIPVNRDDTTDEAPLADMPVERTVETHAPAESVQAAEAPSMEPPHPAEAAHPVETAHPGESGDAAETRHSDATGHSAEADHPAEPPRPAQAAMIPQDTRYGEPEHGDAPMFDTTDEQPLTDDQPLPGEMPLSETRADTENDFDSNPDIDLPPPETIGGESDTFEGNGAEEASKRRASRFLRNYRIQEVIRRRQIILVQVVKEERGTKGAALTTYISLAGRFCVLMPNSPRGGGISRKITSGSDRRRLKEITSALEIPKGMGLIVRTAGANRPKPEITRDCEYLMRLWDDIREHTLKSVAPALIYEEASLIKRAIRDVYSRDVDEILVDGEGGWRQAHDFMRMLMPSHARKVQLWNRAAEPLFAKHGVEEQLDSMLAPTVQLKSGGYLVINQTEALVAIDVNSGRSTRERGIEETALKTNLEAADEVARQLRLRDLAGLIVIDFIDMDAKKHNGMVEKRLKDALKTDRARIQVGFISHFGLLEMSRQRLRPSLAESSFVMCPHCGGLGHVRSVESAALHVLRGIEEEGAKQRASLIMVHVANAIAMFILNSKRQRLAEIESRYAMEVHFTADETLLPPQMRIDRLRAPIPEAERVAAQQALAGPVLPAAPLALPYDDVEAEADDVFGEDEEGDEAPAVATGAAPGSAEEQAANEENERRRRRRRRRRGGRRDDAPETGAMVSAEGDAIPAEAGEEAFPEDIETASVPAEAATDGESDTVAEAEPVAEASGGAAGEQPSLDASDLDENGLPRARRRGRRGGRRRRRDAPGSEAAPGEDSVEAEPVYVAPAYVGPTPADPFGAGPFDIFDMMDEVEEAAPKPRRRPVGAAPLAAAPEASAPEMEAASSLDIPPVPPEATAPLDVSPVVEPEPVEPEPVETGPVQTGPVEAGPVDVGSVEPEPVAPHQVAELTEVPEPLPDAAMVAEPSGEAMPAAGASTEIPAADPVLVQPTAPEPPRMIPIEPAAEPLPQAPITPVPEPEPVAAAPEPEPPPPPAAPLIKPIVIGQDEVPNVERKRGWWKR